MAARNFEDTLMKQATDSAWRSYGKFINKFDEAVDKIHESNIKFANFTCYNGVVCPRLVDTVSEHTDYVELLQTCGNMELNKLMIVFATLCSEMNELARIGLRDFVDPISLYGENRMNTESLDVNNSDDLRDMSKFLNVLYDLNCYINRCLSVIKNLFQQLNAMFTFYKKTKTQPNKQTIEVDGIRFDMVFDHLGQLLVTLINIEEIMRNESVKQDFVNYKRIVAVAMKDATKFSISETNAPKLKTLFGVLTVLERELIDGDRLLMRVITELTNIPESTIAKNVQISDQLITYIRLSATAFEADSNKLRDDKQWLGIISLFIVYVWIFRKDEKKLLKTLLDSERKTGTLFVHLKGNVTVIPDKLFLETLPKSMTSVEKKNFDLLQTQRDSLLKQISLEKEMRRVNYRMTNWLVTFECVMKSSQDSSVNLVGNLLKQGKALEDGLELAIQTSYLIKNYIHLHLSSGKAMSRMDLAYICKLIPVLKAIELSFERRKGDVLLIINTYAQYNSCIALNSLSGMKKRLLADVTKYSEKKLDIISAVILASNCFHGPILTEARQTITSLCLAFTIQSMNESEHLKILPSFNKIEWCSRTMNIMRENTSCELLYFNRVVFGTYFNFVHESDLGQVNELRYFFYALTDCSQLIKRATVQDESRQQQLLKTFETEVWSNFKTEYLDRFCTEYETELRLQTHLDLNLDDQSPFKRRMHNFAMPLACAPFRVLNKFVSISNYVQNYLNEITYNLTTIALHDWKTYESMLNLAKSKYGLTFVTSQLPTQTLEQGLDVLEITRNIHIFVSRYLYNLNNQMFIEKSSENKHLNVLLIRHVANSIQTHGFGIINTAVNFTYQFLRKKFYIFSQFLYEEHIKSRLLKDLRFFRESKATKFPFDKADKLVKGIRKLGLSPEGLSFMDQFRILITEIGNALGFVRMLRSGALHCSSVSVNFVPDLDDLSDVSFETMSKEDGFEGDCLAAAKNLDTVLSTLNRNFGEATDFFKLLVDVFATTFRDQKNYHLKNFYVILPALTLNFVEQSVVSKEKMNRKNKVGASFTDDGFPMGVAYILNLLDQYPEFDSLQWFSSVREKNTIERNEAVKQKNLMATDEKVTQTTSLTLKRLDVLQKEFDLLNYNMVSCKILFKGSSK